MTKRRRGLRPDEAALWDRVTEGARALHPKRKTPPPAEEPPGKAAVQPAQDPAGYPPIPRFRIGEKAPDPGARHVNLPGLSERLAGQPVKMDRKSFGRMLRGKLVPDGKIDLHGMTVAEAHPELTRYLLRAHAEGRRLILVVTGKGRDRDSGGPIPAPRGVLRHQVPLWLAQAPLASLVLQITEAHQKHGGSGAYYVYLRRQPGAG